MTHYKKYPVATLMLLALLGAGCSSQEAKDKCLIKGNINSKGAKIYHNQPTDVTTDVDFFYSATEVDESIGERWFCTKEEAEAAGWRAAKKLK